MGCRGQLVGMAIRRVSSLIIASAEGIATTIGKRRITAFFIIGFLLMLWVTCYLTFLCYNRNGTYHAKSIKDSSDKTIWKETMTYH